MASLFGKNCNGLGVLKRVSFVHARGLTSLNAGKSGTFNQIPSSKLNIQKRYAHDLVDDDVHYNELLAKIAETKKLQSKEQYHGLLLQLNDFCQNELETVQNEDYKIELKEQLLEFQHSKNPEIAELISKFEVLRNQFENEEIHQHTTKVVSFGDNLFIHFEAQVDDKGNAEYNVLLIDKDGGEIVLLADSAEPSITKFSEKQEKALKKVHNKMKFKEVSDEEFQSFIAHAVNVLQ